MEKEGNKSYLFSIVLVAVLGGLLFGYDTAVISGAEKGLQAFFMKMGNVYTDTLHGFTCSSALIGCIIGSWAQEIFDYSWLLVLYFCFGKHASRVIHLY